MSEPFVGEIRAFAFGFVPRGWAACDGSLLAISSNTALFSLLGTTYGGDGRTTFALPDLRDRVPMNTGRGSGLTSRSQGQAGGVDSVTLSTSQVPPHAHPVVALGPANANDPTGAAPATAPTVPQYGPPGQTTAMAADAIGATGQSQSHDNVQPALPLQYAIAVQGLYPRRP